jgi:hypothetical protein
VREHRLTSPAPGAASFRLVAEEEHVGALLDAELDNVEVDRPVLSSQPRQTLPFPDPEHGEKSA